MYTRYMTGNRIKKVMCIKEYISKGRKESLRTVGFVERRACKNKVIQQTSTISVKDDFVTQISKGQHIEQARPKIFAGVFNAKSSSKKNKNISAR